MRRILITLGVVLLTACGVESAPEPAPLNLKFECRARYCQPPVRFRIDPAFGPEGSAAVGLGVLTWGSYGHDVSLAAWDDPRAVAIYAVTPVGLDGDAHWAGYNTSAFINIKPALRPARLQQVATHEVGHLLAGYSDPIHLPEGEKGMMAGDYADITPFVTMTDIDWICERTDRCPVE